MATQISGQQRVPAKPDAVKRSGGFAQVEGFTDADFDGVVFKRVAAYFVDVIVIAALGVLIFGVGSIIGILSLGLLWPFVAGAISILPFAYPTLMMGSPHSATVGMKMFGLELRTWDRRRPGYVQAALHTIMFYATIAVTSFIILGVALFNKRNRCLHDMAVGTVIINQDHDR